MVPLGRSATASLVGAKTVKGPAPERAPVRLPAFRAATSVERSGVTDLKTPLETDIQACHGCTNEYV